MDTKPGEGLMKDDAEPLPLAGPRAAAACAGGFGAIIPPAYVALGVTPTAGRLIAAEFAVIVSAAKVA